MNEFFDKIENQIRMLGYRSPMDFFRGHAGEPYGVLFRLITEGGDHRKRSGIPFLSLRLFHRYVHVRSEGEMSFALDALTRSLREHLRGGWGRSRKAQAAAFSDWNSLERECEDQYSRIWDAITASSPPDSWLPERTQDPLLQKIFAGHWDAEDGGDPSSDPGEVAAR